MPKDSAKIFSPPSPLLTANYKATERIVVNQGGTSSGKTYSILQVLFLRAVKHPGCVITVAGQDIPNLKAGALRDFLRIRDSEPFVADFIKDYNKTDRTFYFHNGSMLEFKSYKDYQDAKSGKRDFLFVNEANGIPYGVYEQLAMRTTKQVFIDYNPTNAFWVHERLIGSEGVKVFISNFSHNPYVDPNVVNHVRGYKEKDPELWRVYGLGITGNIRGLVFRNVNLVPKWPEDCTLIGYGLDFGFSNDFTALVRVGKLHGELYLDELIYEIGMTNPDIARRMEEIGIDKRDVIWADSAEPKSIVEIKKEGFNIKPTVKGPDSIKFGIGILKEYRLNMTATSVNWKREQQNYKWMEKDGALINKPVDAFNHAWDAARYAAMPTLGKLQKNRLKFARPAG